MRSYIHLYVATSILAVLASAYPAFGQVHVDGSNLHLRGSFPVPREHHSENIHVSDLFRSVEYCIELERNTRRTRPAVYDAMMDTTRFTPSSPGKIGDRKDFFVTNFLDKSYEQITAELRAVTSKVLLYVDVRELDSVHVTVDFLDSLIHYLTVRVPKSGENAEGIVSLAQESFGLPPMKSGDTTLVLLLHDIQDGYSGNGGEYITGYFNRHDQTNEPGSNRCDIIYLDTYPTIHPRQPLSLSRSLQSFAHEYQHLIHFNYDPDEDTFIDEGCSMETEYLCGFVRMDADLFFRNTNVPLMKWDTTYPSVQSDLARAQFFILYLERQFGLPFLKHLVQDSLHGLDGVSGALASAGQTASGEDVFEWWTVANQVQNSSIDVRYGYRGMPVSEDLSEKKPLPVRVHNEGWIDGEEVSVLPTASVYISMRNAGYFTARFTGAPELGVHAATQSEVYTLKIDSTSLIPGIHKEVVFIVTNIHPESTLTFRYRFERRSVSYEVRYDAGIPDTMTVDGGKTAYMMVDNSIVGGGAGFALAFKPLEQSTLVRLRFFVGFGQEIPGNSTPESAPRSFIAHIWKNLKPEPAVNLIEARRYTVDRQSTPPNSWFDIPLAEWSQFLTNLTDTIYVGYTDDDAYATGVGLTRLPGPPSHSWFYTGKSWFGGGGLERSTWYSFNDLSWGTPPQAVSLRQWDIMIRTVWMQPLNGVETASGPSDIHLEQNFPNPFVDRTTIRFTLTRPGRVTLAIYDLLGRRVATLLDGEYEGGVYLTEWDGRSDAGGSLPGGLYFCEVRAERTRRVRTVNLVR